jgi:hypothetical protein
MKAAEKHLTAENFESKVFRFRDRQAGVSLIYDPEREVYSYNAYCLEITLVKELYTVEFDFLDDALAQINEEFGSWELTDIAPQQSGCGSCAAH